MKAALSWLICRQLFAAWQLALNRRGAVVSRVQTTEASIISAKSCLSAVARFSSVGIFTRSNTLLSVLRYVQNEWFSRNLLFRGHWKNWNRRSDWTSDTTDRTQIRQLIRIWSIWLSRPELILQFTGCEVQGVKSPKNQSSFEFSFLFSQPNQVRRTPQEHNEIIICLGYDSKPEHFRFQLTDH